MKVLLLVGVCGLLAATPALAAKGRAAAPQLACPPGPATDEVKVTDLRLYPNRMQQVEGRLQPSQYEFQACLSGPAEPRDLVGVKLILAKRNGNFYGQGGNTLCQAVKPRPGVCEGTTFRARAGDLVYRGEALDKDGPSPAAPWALMLVEWIMRGSTVKQQRAFAVRPCLGTRVNELPTCRAGELRMIALDPAATPRE